MSRLPALSAEQIIGALRSAGFLVIVPRRKTVPVGTLLSILEQAGLTREGFLDLL
jgi:predicted RNA binding protein YcfA (HicA-like mRNA interferase family)